MNLRGLLNSIKRENLLMYEYLKNFLIREILDFLYKTIHTRTIDLSGYGNLPNSPMSFYTMNLHDRVCCDQWMKPSLDFDNTFLK